MSDERQSVQPIWLSLLMVTLATYLPFGWILADPARLLPICSVPMVLTLALFTWLGRRGGIMRVVATACAFMLSLVESVAITVFLACFHT